MSEYNPTEYIVDFGDTRSNRFVRLNMALIEQNGAKLGERIVRCRDCEHRVAFEQPLNLERVYCDLRYSLYAVEDEGFCAWGERKAER